jgi:hypothetical protein
LGAREKVWFIIIPRNKNKEPRGLSRSGSISNNEKFGVGPQLLLKNNSEVRPLCGRTVLVGQNLPEASVKEIADRI